MERSEILEKVSSIIEDRMGIIDPITEDQEFRNDLGFDSIDDIELIIECENVFNISIVDSDVENISTVKEAIDYLELCIN